MRIQGDVFVVILEKYIITRSAILGAYFDNIICITTRQAMLIYRYVDDKNQYKEKHDVFFSYFLNQILCNYFVDKYNNQKVR